ncbi:UNVERIFIED_CONTAM: hypothetical protein HDU68_011585, partial [Siphonaria sp. JEL0065]
MTSLISLIAIASLSLQVDARRYFGQSGHYNHNYNLTNFKQIQNCEFTYSTLATDTCGTIATQYVMTLGAFKGLNPTVQCGDGVYFEANQLVCVPSPVNGTATNKSFTAPSSNSTVLSFACSYDYVLQKGDSCNSVATLFNVSATDAFYLNQFLNCEDTVAFTGKPYCLAGTLNTTTGSISLGGPKNVTLNAPIPSDSCNSTVIAGTNQTCADVSKANNITVSLLGAWNKGLDCWNVGEGNTVCVADTVSIPKTTTFVASQTSQAAVPTTVQPSPEAFSPSVCVAKTQCSDDQCGQTISDNCGNSLTCKACPCIPDNTQCSADQCGTKIWDNCGNPIQCDACQCRPSYSCSGKCGQIIDDGCGNQIRCEDCPAPAPQPQPGDLSGDCLYAHNNQRGGLPALQWDYDIANNHAFPVAKHCAENGCWNCHEDSGPGTIFAQNMFLGYGSCSSAIGGWMASAGH